MSSINTNKDQSVEKFSMEKIDNIIKFLEDSAKSVTDFSSEQIPIFITEIIQWGIYYNLAQFIFSLVLLLVCIKHMKYVIYGDFFRPSEEELHGNELTVRQLSTELSM